MAKAKLHIKGKIPPSLGSEDLVDINIWVAFDKSTGHWEVREKDSDDSDDNLPVDPDAPDKLTQVIIHELGTGSPCYIKTSKGLIRIC